MSRRIFVPGDAPDEIRHARPAPAIDLAQKLGAHLLAEIEELQAKDNRIDNPVICVTLSQIIWAIAKSARLPRAKILDLFVEAERTLR